MAQHEICNFYSAHNFSLIKLKLKKQTFEFTELMLQLSALIHQILDSIAAGVNQEFSDSLCSG